MQYLELILDFDYSRREINPLLSSLSFLYLSFHLFFSLILWVTLFNSSKQILLTRFLFSQVTESLILLEVARVLKHRCQYSLYISLGWVGGAAGILVGSPFDVVKVGKDKRESECL